MYDFGFGSRTAKGGFANELAICKKFNNWEKRVSPGGSLYIGRITMQRKGGTPDPTKLQFKIKPCDLFKLEGSESNE